MLKNFEIFRGLTDAELEDITGIVQTVTFPRGALIFNQGDIFSDFFIIESGQVEISVKDPFHERKVLTILRNHDFFGEMGLFDRNAIRSATAKALQTTRLLLIPGIGFEELLRMKPSISMKLLSTISRRLKDSNLKIAMAQAGERSKEGKILTLASARNGYGKTTFTTTIAQLMGRELTKSVVYVDLDLHYGDGSYYMGISSAKTIHDFNATISANPNPTRDEVLKMLFRHSENLYSLPAPTTFLEAEEVNPNCFVTTAKALRSHFDYIILDTDSAISDLFLNALDVSDFIVLLADINSPVAVKNSVRYFQALSKLNFPPDRINILATKTGDDFNAERVTATFKNEFKFKILGGIPMIKGPSPDFGKTFFHLSPESHYCGLLRHFIKIVLKEDIQSSAKVEGTILNRLFGKNERGENLWVGKIDASEVALETLRPDIEEKSLQSMFQYVRQKLIEGFSDQVRSEILSILEVCPRSNIAYQYLGECYMAERNFSEAISAFHKALELNPENALAMGFSAHLNGREDTFVRAVNLLQKHMDTQPNYADLQNDMGRLLFLKGDFQKALSFFQKALKINPKFTEAKINVGITFGELHQIEQAVSELERVKPPNLRVNYLLGRFHYNQERFADALKYFEKAALIKADYLELPNRIEALYGYFKQLNILLEKYQELIKNHPDFPDLHLCLAELYFHSGQYKDAVKEAKEAIRLKPDYKEAKTKLEEFTKRAS